MAEEATLDEQYAFKRLNRIHGLIDRSLFYNDPPLDYQKTMRAIELLAKLIHEYDYDTERIWYIGESGSCTTDSLLVGAYWFFVDYRSGQWSDEYRTQCVIEQVFSPGMSCGPEEESTEMDVYEALERISGYKTEE
jgi:hypothetical protein